MLEARRIATRPLPVVRGLRFGDVAVAVAADALVRRAWALGRNTELVVPAAGGDLGTQFVFERELAKEGHDRSSVGDDEYEARAAAFAADRMAAAAEVFARLGVTVDVGAASTVADDAVAAARTAFVTLYEQGMVEQLDRVVATCPRCRTPVDGADVVEAEHEAELVTVRVETTGEGDEDEALEVVLAEVELLPGVVAVAVPDGHPLAGAGVGAVVPIAGREVPIVADPLRATPGFVVPAHDAEGHAIAQANGLSPIQVLDDDGVVCVDGPLVNLGRYAARQAARDLLAAEGAIVASEATVEQVGRCACCGTVLVPQLGRHWFLRSGDLEVAAADAVRHGDLVFQPPDARDAFLATAGIRREWCVSSRVEGGVSMPVAVCLDCGKLTVDATPSPSCGKCMGVLVGEGSSLDARFVAAAWALANAGWPRERDPSADTVVVVGEDDLAGWVLPSLALGLRLTAALPFAGVVVHPWPGDADVSAREADLFLDADPRVLRFALVAGTDDLDAAAAAVAALDSPSASASSDDGDDAVAAGLAALDDGAPGLAATLLASALGAGVPAAAADRLRALVLPILGD
jgi:valyl-tRNA synthetase